jgi:hypothetical protein
VKWRLFAATYGVRIPSKKRHSLAWWLINAIILEPLTEPHHFRAPHRSTVLSDCKHTKKRNFFCSRNFSISFARSNALERLETSLPCNNSLHRSLTTAPKRSQIAICFTLIGFSSSHYKSAYQGQTLIIHTPKQVRALNYCLLGCWFNMTKEQTQTHLTFFRNFLKCLKSKCFHYRLSLLNSVKESTNRMWIETNSYVRSRSLEAS